MSRIVVSPEEVRQLAGEFMRQSNASQEMINQLSTSVANLDQTWDGMANERFKGQFEDWKKSMGGFVIMLDMIHKELMNIAQRFEDADKAG